MSQSNVEQKESWQPLPPAAGRIPEQLGQRRATDEPSELKKSDSLMVFGRFRRASGRVEGFLRRWEFGFEGRGVGGLLDRLFGPLAAGSASRRVLFLGRSLTRPPARSAQVPVFVSLGSEHWSSRFCRSDAVQTPSNPPSEVKKPKKINQKSRSYPLRSRFRASGPGNSNSSWSNLCTDQVSSKSASWRSSFCHFLLIRSEG